MTRRPRSGFSRESGIRRGRRSQLAPPEQLEERLMLSGTPISVGEQTAILAGLEQLGVVGGEFDGAHQLALALPVVATTNGKAADQSVGQLASLGDFLTTRLDKIVVTYFDGDPNPTVEGLQAALQSIAPGVSGTVNNGVLSFQFPSFGFQTTTDLGIDLGIAGESLALSVNPAAQPLTMTIGATISNFTFSVETNNNNLFFISSQASITYSAQDTTRDFGLDVGFLGATTNQAAIQVSPSVVVDFISPNLDGRVTLPQLGDKDIDDFTVISGSARSMSICPSRPA